MKRGQWVDVPLDLLLGGVVVALGIRYEVQADRMRVWVNDEADGALERMVGVLADVRWRYEQGRELQLGLPGLDSRQGRAGMTGPGMAGEE